MASAKIGGLKFRIVEIKNLMDEDLKLEGDINYYTQLIRLERQLPPVTKDVVLLHEMLHGLLTLGIDRDLGANENFILTLAHSLHALLKDNPKVFMDIIQRQ